MQNRGEGRVGGRTHGIGERSQRNGAALCVDHRSGADRVATSYRDLLGDRPSTVQQGGQNNRYAQSFLRQVL